MTTTYSAGAGTDIEGLLDRLTLEQKIRLLSGGGTFRGQAEPAIGLRAIVFSDGPVGVRGERWDERDTALTLPSPTAMAATWDPELVTGLGRLLAAEARRKGVDVLLAPNLNLHRSPLGGRHFECFSEDPLLTARIGAAYITGVQSGGVAATAKHYVANESETERLTLDARIDERTLREVYLLPFEEAVRAGTWVVMSAYNGVNGTSMSDSPLLAEPLRGEWGFDGLVVSDWGAVRTVGSPVDLAMPGPHELRGEPLVDAVRRGDVPESEIDGKVRRILLLARRVGALEPTASVPPPRITPDESRGRLRRAAAAGSVLLRNSGSLLPFDPSALTRVAVIGPNAVDARVQGGGSAGVFPAAVVSPVDGIRSALAGRADVVHRAGAFLHTRPTPLTPADSRNPITGEPGVQVRYLGADDEVLHVEHRLSGRVLEPSVELTATTVEVSALMRPSSTGDWRFAIVGLGAVSLEVDGHRLVDEHVVPESDDPTYVHVAPSFREVTWPVEAGRDVLLRARRRMEPDQGLAVALAADPPRVDENAELAAAVELARGADVAVVVVGTTDEIESEGFDRGSLELPGRQDELVRAVAAANPRTVVVVNAGGPVELPWREEVAAVLVTWFPGQEAGDGLADVLFGLVEPGGRLPTTWAARTPDAPVLDTKPIGGVLEYTEGSRIGYRAWAGSPVPPAYWFGHGLGYTTWSYEGFSARDNVAVEEGFDVRVRVRNTGSRTGRDVVQVYQADGEDRRLVGYAAVVAAPGEAVWVRVPIEPRALRRWSPVEGRWVPETGAITLMAGPSSGDLPLVARLNTSV
ncbi:glycoside hydrolase family 3 C-terminal domain-containing protein [Umezawaea sp. Da 62-37]|uniref:glycoside hydrolase family 3 C-terminal domain-containing protein n=1 Tax=Umezawaea sp. Da 62-37 TaxID=3075927 RepID=UPI0028F722D3|nr:glycoside hydrolase family 3 C-terminal domain-containing protein [Umezawaea sp. Da 62-37]WNV84632.1 glycoside hydrolase family 3 C-terminal domain-containing protein [Umezawaea sp. Da 62-37]